MKMAVHSIFRLKDTNHSSAVVCIYFDVWYYSVFWYLGHQRSARLVSPLLVCCCFEHSLVQLIVLYEVADKEEDKVSEHFMVLFTCSRTICSSVLLGKVLPLE